MHRSLVALATTVACLIVAPSAFAWNGAQWSKNTCGADLTAHAANGSWWIRVSDESGTLAEASNIPAKAYTDTVPLTVGGFSHDGGYHLVKYEAANAANHADGYVSYTQPQWNCTGGRGPAGPPGPKGDPGVGYDCTGTAVPTGGTPALCPGQTPNNPPSLAKCKSNRVYRVKVGDKFRGQKIHVAKLTWDNGQRHTTAIRRSDGRLHAVVSFKGVTSPLRGLWTIRLDITFDGGKHATLTRNVRLCSPDDGNLNFATDVHRDGS